VLDIIKSDEVKDMFLRHITLKKWLKAIYESECLDPSKTPRHGIDREYMSFELNPVSDILFRAFPKLKSNPISNIQDGEQFELLFDADKMQTDGIELVEKVGANSKRELEMTLRLSGFSKQEIESVGEYRFIKGKVSLKYLTSESKRQLEQFIRENSQT